MTTTEKKKTMSLCEALERFDDIRQKLRQAGHPDVEAYDIVINELMAYGTIINLVVRLKPVVNQICKSDAAKEFL